MAQDIPEHSFATILCRWQGECGRHGLPWQVRDPYRRWLSEVMLQQTQVSVVKGYFERFLARFPTLESLAAADISEVMPLWAGLGYYSRCRNLHACAQAVVRSFGGEFPHSVDELMKLPGIGRSTAGAIASACWDVPVPILDGNARRVLARHFGIEGPHSDAAVLRALWERAEREVPARDPGTYAQALMDLGSAVCTRTPHCRECPVRDSCEALRLGREKQIPAPRARRQRPVRTVSVIAYLQDGGVWLVPRTARGVWQGLESFPEADAELDSARVLSMAAEAGFAGAQCSRLPDAVHDFTHYRLVMQPWAVKVAAGALAGARLVPAEDLEGSALPSPILRLALSMLR